MAKTDIKFLWMKYYDSTSQWSDYRNRKISNTNSLTTEPWIEQEFRKRGIKVRTSEGQSEPGKNEIFNIVELLKTCGTSKDLIKGLKLHAYIREHRFLEKHSYVASALVSMYAKCGALAKAEQVLRELPVQDVVAWNSLIAGYAQQGYGDEALKCYDSMQLEGHSPNSVTFTCALKACGSIGAAAKGEEIHDQVVRLGMLYKDIVLGNILVDMYVKCGSLSKARQVLEELPSRDVVTWTALIVGYVQQGKGHEALKCFDSMQREGHAPNAVTYISALKACGSIQAVAKGKQIHDKIVNSGMLETNIVLGSTLVDMYVKCGALAQAQQVLEDLPFRNAVSWSALIAGYAQQGQGEEALKCFDGMQREGQFPDAFTLTSALKACGSIGATARGEQIHNKAINLGLLEKNVVVGNALVDMYAKCGALAKAQQVLKELPVRNAITWNALIGGYVQHGNGEEALKCYDSMQQEGQSPDAVTFISVLKACGSIGAVNRGILIHEKIVSLTLLETNIVLGNALVDMYSKLGALGKAQQVLEGLPVRNLVTWNALLAGYVQQGQGEEGLRWYDCMQHEGHFPDVVTFNLALKACGSIGAAAKGEQIHEKIAPLGMLENNMALRSTLGDMYAKCGELGKAQQVLKELPVWDVVTWAALIGGYAQQGQSLEALNCFETMQLKDTQPNSTTLVCMLNACSHSGLLDWAENIFLAMKIKYGITPDGEHCCCMVDMFGRAGKLNKALAVIEMMPSVYLPIWIALLGACRKCSEVKVGRMAFEHVLQLDKSNAAIYICMTDIYTATGMQEDANIVELMRLENKAWTLLDCHW